MAQHSQVPEFGDWENKEDVSYTVYFEKKKKNRNSKNKPQIYYPSSDSEASFQAQDEAEIKFGETAKSDPGRPKNREFRDPPKTKQESRVSLVEVDLRKSTDSPTHPKRIPRQTVHSDQHFDSSQMHPHHKEKARNKGSPSSSTWEEVDLGKSTDSPKLPKGISRQSVGSDKSFDRSPMHPHHQEKVRNKVSNSSALGERKVSSEGIHGGAASSTPGRSRFRQVPLEENTDDSPAIPKFGDWDDNDPRTGEPYTEVFNKARKDKQAAGGRSPAITNENANFYGRRDENFKGCGCFPWGQKMISGLKSGRG